MGCKELNPTEQLSTNTSQHSLSCGYWRLKRVVRHISCLQGAYHQYKNIALWDWYSVKTSSVMSDSFVTPWTVPGQAPLSMGFSRQEEWNGLPLPSPGDLPNPGIKPMSPALTGRLFTIESPGKPSVKKRR